MLLNKLEKSSTEMYAFFFGMESNYFCIDINWAVPMSQVYKFEKSSKAIKKALRTVLSK